MPMSSNELPAKLWICGSPEDVQTLGGLGGGGGAGSGDGAGGGVNGTGGGGLGGGDGAQRPAPQSSQSVPSMHAE